MAEDWNAVAAEVDEDQRKGIRQALSEGLSKGQNPRQTAVDVVGRVNRVTGHRQGGVIGHTASQERYVAAARQELLSGSPITCVAISAGAQTSGLMPLC